MQASELSHCQDLAVSYATEVGLKIAAAIVFWIVGRWLIGVAGRMIVQQPG